MVQPAASMTSFPSRAPAGAFATEPSANAQPIAALSPPAASELPQADSFAALRRALDESAMRRQMLEQMLF